MVLSSSGYQSVLRKHILRPALGISVVHKMFMSLQEIAKPVNLSETSESTLSSTLFSLSHEGATAGAPHGTRCKTLYSGTPGETTKMPKFLILTHLPWGQPSGNRLKWLQGHSCRALQICFVTPVKSLLYFLACWDMEGTHLEMSEHWAPCVLSALILLQLEITQRFGRKKFKSLPCNEFCLWL